MNNPDTVPRQGFIRRFSLWRDEQLARHALKVAGEPGLVLDLPSGTGRFWSVLAEHTNRVILAGDQSADKLAVAENQCSTDVLKRVKTFQTSAFSIDLNENAVDCIFCMRLFHHISSDDERSEILREFHRVSRDTVIVALWVDGNIRSWRRKRLQTHRDNCASPQARRSRFVVSRTAIKREFETCGFRILGHYDFLPGYAMWRVYVLRKISQAIR
ncbi:MAG TPA: class I SAM-dependent methyltransferase [Pseudomonas sp.]|jgi:SAM-dependent methyltransferase|uniref:class I SAM-dependent methyltransferase n=1 Tax=Pseudomonas sp. TaxID=306 RepID=UPI002ED7EB8B